MAVVFLVVLVVVVVVAAADFGAIGAKSCRCASSSSRHHPSCSCEACGCRTEASPCRSPQGHARPDEILAVTYTKNAAQEMRQRVEDAEKEVLSPTPDTRPPRTC